jgi:ribonuclease T1
LHRSAARAARLAAIGTLAALCALCTLVGPASAQPAPRALPEVVLAELPREARDTYALIRRGGPFPHERDGIAFGNREGLLPAKPRGYYREYTVRTPGLSHRGARRIVCGGSRTAPEACYYTSDHYRSFRRIRE